MPHAFDLNRGEYFAVGDERQPSRSRGLSGLGASHESTVYEAREEGIGVAIKP